MINGARVLPRMPAVKNKRDTRGHNKGVPVGRWASCRAPNSLTYHWGRLSCKRFPHRWNWWRSRVCSAAACGVGPPCKMHCRQLKKAEEESIHSTWRKTNAVLNKIIKYNYVLGYIICRERRSVPLQFLAILNMLAALQYISHASSTLWGPLQEKRERDSSAVFKKSFTTSWRRVKWPNWTLPTPPRRDNVRL